MGNYQIINFSDENKITSIIKYENKSFEKVSKDISLENLTYNNSYLSSQKYLKESQKFNEYKSRSNRLFLLKKAYKDDNTNLQIIEEFQELKNQLDENKDSQILKEINEILELYEPLLNKTKEYQISKIFELIELIKNYDCTNIYDIFKIDNYLTNFKKANKIGLEFNIEISPENGTVYIYTLYYSWVIKLNKILEKYNNETYENYYNEELKNKSDEIKIFLDNQKDDTLKKIKVLLGIKNDMKEKDITVMANQEINKEISNNNDIPNNKTIKSEKIKELENLIDKLNINNHCIKSIDNYLNEFYRIYLGQLQIFLNNIPNTLKYLKNLDYYEQINIKILRDFVFFLSYFHFDKEIIDNIIDYYEKTFDEFKIPTNFKIKGNNLINPLSIKLENYENYNLNCYPLKSMAKNRFLYEAYIKYYLLPEKNIFEKYKKIFKNFIKNIFLNENSCVKKLFVDTFPVMEDNYFINEDLLNFIFDKKITAFNYLNKKLTGIIISSNLDIFIKVNFIHNNDTIETEICIFAAFIVILIHELSNFILIYIFKHLGIKEYEKSFFFKENEEPEIGRFIEKKLFGRVIEEMNLIEAIYILNINNFYRKNPEQFLNGFINLKKKKTIDKLEDSVKDFLNSVDIILNQKINLNGKNKLTLKGSGNYLNIGINNDKYLMRETLLNLHKFMDEKFGK